MGFIYDTLGLKGYRYFIFILFHISPSSTALYDLLDQLDDAETSENELVLIPPIPEDNSDEYSGDEEEEEVDLDHLPGRILRSTVEPRRPAIESDDEHEESSAPVPGPNRQRGRGRAGRSGAQSRQRAVETWMKAKTTSGNHALFPEKNTTRYKDFQPHQLFELFFDEVLLSEIIRQSLLYATKKAGVNLALSVSELKVFLAILLLSGYSSVPRQRMYWECGPDVFNEAVSKAMRRQRFMDIKRFIHFEEQVNKEDRYSKVRLLATHLQAAFLEHYIPSRFLSHDEALIKYFGKSSLKQSIRMKPIRFGYKVWCLNDPLGYLVAFELYQGQNFQGDADVDLRLEKCSGTVIHLLNKLQSVDAMKNLQFHITFDNLFTSIGLLRELHNRGLHGTGTVRQNRVPSDPLLSVDRMKKKERGYSESAKSSDGAIKLTRWKDNQVVTIMSTLYGVYPQDQASRWSREQKKRILVTRPAAVREYNRQMGGTDRMNQNVNKYRIRVQGKKFYWHVFTWLLDVAVGNAWSLHRQIGGGMDLLEFRRSIVMFYLKAFGATPSAPGPRPQRPIGDAARYEGRDHWPQKIQDDGRKRCANPNCDGRDRNGRNPLSRFQCTRCEVALCLERCFMNYHTR